MSMLAAVDCHRDGCPSDSADHAPLWAIKDGQRSIIGGMWRCCLCSLRWLSVTGHPDRVPDEVYWHGDEWDG